MNLFYTHTAACAVIGLVWSTAAYAAPIHVCFTEACAAFGSVFLQQPVLPLDVSVQKQPVCPTAAYAALACVCSSVQQQTVLNRNVIVLQQPVLPWTCLYDGSLCCPWTYLFYSSLCCL
jgi:hypothetical protein